MTQKDVNQKMTNFRWVLCGLLFLATTINYMDRQVLSLTWKDFIAPEFHWTDTNYGIIAAAFSICYAIANIFSGHIIDWLGTKKGYLWAIGIWSAGACLHAACGWATEHVVGMSSAATLIGATGGVVSTITTVSVFFFIAARIVLAVGESGNFPSAVKVTAEYFPKRDRAFATSIFNAGSTVGALVAPLCIPSIASYFRSIGVGNGWEMAFVLIGVLGFVWMGFWVFAYKDLDHNPHVNAAERSYILQDNDSNAGEATTDEGRAIGVGECARLRQTWAIILAKFFSDGVWWFILFWTPAYISDVMGYRSDTFMAQMLIFTLYALTLLSLYGGKLPSIIMDRTGRGAYDSRVRAMFIFAVVPLLGLLAQPLGRYSCWFTIILLGLILAAHQSWSANLYSVGSDLFPKRTVGTITSLNGMAGGVGSFLINIGSGYLLDYVAAHHVCIMGFEGKEAGYMLIFCYCSVAYLIGWSIMKALVPKYNPVK